MNVKITKRTETTILILLLFAGFLVRLYRFNNPIADWHAWRQADTSAVSRNFVQEGFDILHPKFDDLSNVASGIDNPNGYRFVEFPIFNLVQGLTFRYIGILTLEEWGRLITIFASIFSSVFLYLLISKRFGKPAGFLTTFFFLFLPFNIYYSRTILPDPSMVAAVLGGIYFFDLWINQKQLSIFDYKFLLSLSFTAVSFLLKPYALFFMLPMLYLAFEKFKFDIFKKWQLWIFLVISILPLAAWRTWMLNFPEGIPASSWLFNGNHIRFKPSFFYWVFYERIIKLILGYFGTIFVVIPFLRKYKNKNFWFLLSFVISSLVYVFVIATGNVQHDYYQILIIPSIAIVLGVGAFYLILSLEKIRKYLGILIFLIITGLSFYFSWNLVKDYFNVNNYSIVLAGKEVNNLTSKKAKVIANYNGDTSFLYQTERKGWASFEKGLPEMVKMGASYLILVNPTKIDLNIGKTYKIIVANKDFVIFDLLKKP